ncbi:hypothetical protein GJAV_G00045850 [Gymnothorax javanicus]|nr:hypothetical protein GJAV_G00045850 [Gymnothorax javanicus]
MMDLHSGNTCNRNNSNEDFSVNVFSVTPCPPSRSDTEASERDKTGVVLLFSGVSLGLVGIAFTVMGWMDYNISKNGNNFAWIQLLGPILLLFGAMFVLTSVCKFKMLACKICEHCDERPSDEEPAQHGQSYVFTGINRPITLHGARVLQCIPPPYAHVTHNGSTSEMTQSTGIMPGVSRTACPPQYCSIYPLGNTITSEHSCPECLRLDNCDVGNFENETMPGGKVIADETPPTSAPPAYDDIFPVPLSGSST